MLPQTNGLTLQNFGGEYCPTSGTDLAAILLQSCDTSFALIGKELGAEKLYNEAVAFGFNRVPPIDLPKAGPGVPGEVAKSNFPPPGDFVGDIPGLMKSAIGQENVTATTLQMALVAAGIANDGVIMVPHLLDKIIDDQGNVVKTYQPRAWRRATSAKTAPMVRQLMLGVTQNPDGTAYGLFPASEFPPIAAKTGTAQINAQGCGTYNWLIATGACRDGPDADRRRRGDRPDAARTLLLQRRHRCEDRRPRRRRRPAEGPGDAAMSTVPPDRVPGRAGPTNRLPPTMSDSPPPVYNGRYELSRQIARGGTAQVYLAHDLLLDRPVALKMLFPELSSDHSFVERFRREAQAAANLSHPNIVPVFDWGEADRPISSSWSTSTASRSRRSSAPRRRWRRRGRPPIAADIAKALSYAHRHGVVHRDVKPGNVLITTDGQVKVTDFGIAAGDRRQRERHPDRAGDGHRDLLLARAGPGPRRRRPQRRLLPRRGAVRDGHRPATVHGRHAGRDRLQARLGDRRCSPSEIEPRGARATSRRSSCRRWPSSRRAGTPRRRTSTTISSASCAASRCSHRCRKATRAPRPLRSSPTRRCLLRNPVDRSRRPRYRSRSRGRPRAGGQDELPKRRFVPWAAAAVLLAGALGALIYFGGRSLGYFGAAASFHPPNVQGQNYLKAEQHLRAAGLVPVIAKRDFSPLAVKGLVKSQSPLPNTLVTKGDDVNLTVLIGPPPPKQVFLGFFKGDLLSAVKPQLQAEGFKVVVVPQVPSSAAIPQGTILDQSPAGSQKYPFGTQVTLTVARGTQKVTIPTKGVVGQSITSARDTLTALGFTVVLGGSEFSTATPPVPSGDVITTNPPPGTPASQGSTVGLIVSKGPAAIMPLVAQNPPITEARAIKLIKAANLVPMVIDVATPGFQAGFVTSQTPSSGTQLTPGSTVTIFVEQSTSTTTTTSTSSTTTTTTTPGGPTGVTGPSGPSGTWQGPASPAAAPGSRASGGSAGGGTGARGEAEEVAREGRGPPRP